MEKKSFFSFFDIKSIVILAIPAMIENVSQVFIGVVDIYFVGRLGTEAVAAVGLTNLIMNVYIAFFQAIGIGVVAFVARYLGAGKPSKAHHIIRQSIILGIATGVFFGSINLIFARRFLLFFGVEEAVMFYAYPYFLVVAVPSVFLCVSMILSSALRGSGDTKTPMKAALLSNVVNAVLDAVLIFGIFNFSGLGIVGAGIASSFSRLLSVVFLANAIKRRKGKDSFRGFNSWKIDWPVLKSITNISAPAAVERLIMRSGQIVYGGMIIQIGTEAYAAHNIAGTIETFSYLPGMGFGVAAATLVGQSLGQKKEDEAKALGSLSYLVSVLVMVLIGAVFYVFAPILAGLFTRDETVITQVVQVLRIIALFQPFLAMTLVISSALQGAGDTKFPMYSSFIGIWVIRVLGIYILALQMDYGLQGVWIAYAIDITIRGSILMTRFLKGKWKNIEID